MSEDLKFKKLHLFLHNQIIEKLRFTIFSFRSSFVKLNSKLDAGFSDINNKVDTGLSDVL